MNINKKTSRRIGNQLNVDWEEIPFSEFHMGMNVELEHGSKISSKTDITGDNLEITGKIALAHLLEDPEYYTKLKKIEDGKKGRGKKLQKKTPNKNHKDALKESLLMTMVNGPSRLDSGLELNDTNILFEYIKRIVSETIQDVKQNPEGNDQPKKLLLLVHPDIVFEPGNVNFIRRYIDRLQEHMSTFDYVITHKFFSDSAPELIDNIGNNIDLWNELMDVLEAESDWIKRDYKFSASFKDALPDYLIENEGTQIWLGGGYEKLCVADTRKSLLRNLDDIIKETGASIAGCYMPLIVTERHRPSFGDEEVKEPSDTLRECIGMIIKEEIKKRSHMSQTEMEEFKDISVDEQEIDYKPKGFWYDCDGEWSNWVEMNMPEWLGEHKYDVELEHSEMKVIRNYEELKRFNDEYSINPEVSEDFYLDDLIDWRRVATDYAGIEICPYINKIEQIRKNGKVFKWYTSWDVASGCIWDKRAIKTIKKR